MSNGFAAAFQSVAGFLGRPTSETVLFSGVPFDEQRPTIEEIEQLSTRIGLESQPIPAQQFTRGAFETPLILILNGGGAISLLEETTPGRYVTNQKSADGTPEVVTVPECIALGPIGAFSFSLVYANRSEEGVSGVAEQIDRLHWLKSVLKPFWRSYLDVVLATLFINLVALAIPLFTMNVYDRILPNKAIASLWVLAIGVSLGLLFDFTLKSIRASIIDSAGRKADLKLSYLLFEKILNSSLKSRPMSTGEYANRVTQYEFVREFFTSNTISTLIDCTFVFIFVGAIYLIIGWIAIVPVVAFFVAAAIGYYAQIRIGQVMTASLNEGSMKQSLLFESISGLETIKLLSAEKPLLRRWQQLSRNASHTSEDIKEISAWAANCTGFIQQLVTVVIVVAGVYEFAEGHVTSGAIVASSMLAGRAVGPLAQLALTLSRFRQAIMSLRILEGIMEQEEDRPNTSGFVSRTITSGAVAFQGAEFTYPGTDNKVVNSLSVSIRPGERVGVIGRIGSGKTTMGRLLSGLYPVDKGRILIDGVDIRQYHPAAVREAVAFVSQNSELFSGTVKENLLMAAPEASDEEIIAAARIAGVDGFVSRHPKGYDMPVGERGSLLSGGQRHSLAIARVLLRKPKVVFLDEPSGSMDMASEKELIDRLSTNFPAGVTLIISTHRYSMLSLVDRLLVLEEGRLVADGPKDRVIDQLKGQAPPQAQPQPPVRARV